MSGTEYWITIIFQLCVLLIRSAVSILGSPIMSRSSVIQFQWDLIVVASDISFTNSKVNYFGVSGLPVLMFEMVSVQFFSNLIGFMFFLSKQKQMVQWTLTWIQVFNAGVYLYCLSREILRVHVPQQNA